MALDFLTPTDHREALGRLGCYEILGVVGAGGMGMVLKALDPSLNRIVAVYFCSSCGEPTCGSQFRGLLATGI